MAVNSLSALGGAHLEPSRAELAHQRQPWYFAYMAALFESDRKQIAARIHNAERLILKRESELLSQHTEFVEQRALNNALHALEALASCLRLE